MNSPDSAEFISLVKAVNSCKMKFDELSQSIFKFLPNNQDLNEIKEKTISTLKIWNKYQMDEKIYRAFFWAFVKKYVKFDEILHKKIFKEFNKGIYS